MKESTKSKIIGSGEKKIDLIFAIFRVRCREPHCEDEDDLLLVFGLGEKFSEFAEEGFDVGDDADGLP